MAEAFAERYKIAETIDSQEIFNISTAFFEYLKNNFVIKKVYRKYPLSLHLNDRLFERIIDLILETEDGIVVIQNSGFSGGQKGWPKKSKELADFLYLTEIAVKEIFNIQKVRSYVHFVLGAGLIEVKIQQKVIV